MPNANPDPTAERTTYRVRYTMTVIIIVWVAMLAVMIIAAFEPRARLETWQSLAAVIGYAIVTSPALRTALASVRATAAGLTVINTLHTYRLAWNEIDRIEMGRYKVFFELCLIYATDGRVIPAIGLGTSPGRPKRRASIEAREAVEALQGRLAAARAGLGSTRQQIES